MRMYAAWARANPDGWERREIASGQDVRALPDKGIPDRRFDPAVDGDALGWIIGINVQGVEIFGFDHLHISPGQGNRLVVTAWNDDPDDFPPGMRWGIEWTFLTPAPDPVVGLRVNTRQSLKVWDEQGRPAGWYGTSTTSGPVEYLPWSDFREPQPANQTRHGVWVDTDCENCAHPLEDHEVEPYKGATGDPCQHGDCTGYASLWRRHRDALAATPHGWREWLG